MPRSFPPPASALPLVPLALAATSLLASAGAQQPSTQLHYSTVFPGSDVDVGSTVHRKANGHLIITGTTTSPNLPTTPGVFQPQPNGSSDVFVACLDLSLPSAQQIVWCTLLGGSGMEIAFAAHVDALGAITVVGLTDSPDFPMNAAVPGFQTSRNGPSDGFIARLDPNGTALLYATYLGGSSHDRLCGLAADSAGRMAVIGVTESTDLPNTAGAAFPTYQGGNTDAMLAWIDPSLAPAQQLRWATYIGGALQEGPTYASIASNGGLGPYWEGNLDRQNVALLPNGQIATTMVCNVGTTAMVTTGSFQASTSGADAHVGFFDAATGALTYGTFFGGSGIDVPWAMAAHPAGGVVIAGLTTSSNLPLSGSPFQTVNRYGSGGSNDSFVCWLDPGQGSGNRQLRYATYFGGDGGEDIFTAMAIDSAGTVTLAGTGFGGGANPYPTTPGSHRTSAPSHDRCGAVVRMRLENRGARDLVYSTLIGAAWTVLEGLALDDLGDAYVIGSWGDIGYPTTPNAMATRNLGLKDVVLTHLPLLPGGTRRHDVGLATPACAAPLHAAVLGAPQVGNPDFALGATNAPALGLGAVVFGFGPPANGPLPLANATLLVDPLVVSTFVVGDALGFASSAFPVPAGAPTNLVVHSQWAFLTNAACPGSGPVAASERLVFRTF